MYQIAINDHQDGITVNLVPELKTKKIDSDLIKNKLTTIFGNKTIGITISEYILPSRRGKFRSVIKHNN